MSAIPEKDPVPPLQEPYEPSKDECLWATLAHLSGLLAAALSAGMLVFLGPLIIWLVKKDESAFVDDQGKEALNFQLTILILYLAAGAVAAATCGVGIPLLGVPLVLQIVFAILAAIDSNRGRWYRYPVNIRFVK